MKNYCLVVIFLCSLVITAHSANTIDDKFLVAMGFSSTNDDAGRYVHKKIVAINGYCSCLLSNNNGPTAALYAARNLLPNIVKQYYGTGNWQLALNQGFVQTYRNFCANNECSESTFATVVSLHNNQIFAAHVGNAQAILIKHKIPLLLTTTSHSLSNSAEKSTMDAQTTINDDYFSAEEPETNTATFSGIPGSLNDKTLKFPHQAVSAEPSIQVVNMNGDDACVVIATGEFWRRRDITKTTNFCLNYLDELKINSLDDWHFHAKYIAIGLVNSVTYNLKEDKDKQIAVMVLLIKKT